MLINMEEMLKVADKNQFAVGAFNATESSLFRAVVEEAEAQNAPAIVQVAPFPPPLWQRGFAHCFEDV